MLKARFSKLLIAALCISCVLQGSVTARPDGWRAITILVESLKESSSLSAKERGEKAYQLATLIRRKAGKPAPKKLITDLADLMSDADTMVRAWTAGSLGNLGPQAAAAMPALEKAFEEAQAADPPDRPRTGIHLDDVIQQALEKIDGRKKLVL
ncbi:MAG TPA: hypothetical protein VJU86_06320 [Pyrinomonadaceae bacterium]|nr:hypothetical protein [Pyrinomonadaceae bacterium]